MTSCLTKTNKEDLLKLKGFKKEEGFCMDYDKPEDDNLLSIFITKEEWIEKTMAGCKTYYWNGRAERMLDFNEAWEYLSEDLWDEFGSDNEGHFENECLKLLK